jgi:hypothetical protein
MKKHIVFLLLSTSVLSLMGCAKASSSNPISSSSNPVASSSNQTSSSPESSVKEFFTITWKDWNGTILETDTEVEAGTSPTYDGVTPTREMDDEGTYQFNGWSPAITAVTADTIYTAAYKQTAFIFSTFTYTYHSDTSTYSVKKGDNAATATAIFVPSVADDGTNGSHPVTAMEKLAFSDYYHMLKAKIPASITAIADYPFLSDSSACSLVVDAENPNYWSDGKALYNKDKTIIYEVLAGVVGSYTILDTVATIYTECFTIVRKVVDLSCPASLTFIGNAAFNMSGLKTITYADTKAKWITLCNDPNYPVLNNVNVPTDDIVTCSDGKTKFNGSAWVDVA